MLSNDLKQSIQQAYRQFLDNKGLKPRYGQKLMIAEIARTLGAIKSDDEGKRTSDPAVAVVEAGTGTGKTVAYALAAIPIAQAADKRLIISTATVALQEQIVFKDLPDIRQQSGLKFSFTLAKGRGRYVCLSKLDHLLQSGQENVATMELFAQEGFHIDVDEGAVKLYQEMVEQLATNRWDGDRDNWKGELDEGLWRTVTTDHGQCSGRRCTNFGQCAFYKAREELTRADVVVANHDLVLADLALGGGAILSAPGDSIYIFDEGHHLPDKAINHFAHHGRLHGTESWLEQSSKQVSKLVAQNALPGDLGRWLEQLPPRLQEALESQRQMYALMESATEFPNPDGYRPSYRFPNGVVPAPVRELAGHLKAHFSTICELLTRLCDELKEAMDGKVDGVDVIDAEAWYPLLGAMLSRAESAFGLWQLYSIEDPEGEPPIARWVQLLDQEGHYDLEVACSPILAARTLRQSLWNCCYGAVVTSATLTALGRFDRIQMRAGIPDSASCAVVPSPFYHSDAATLRIPAMSADPKLPDQHTEAVIECLPAMLEEQPGTLVLFSSRRQMLDVFAGVGRQWQQRILVQGDRSKQELLTQHRKRIDDDKPSVIFGLASFAEGVDLPGRYCEQVIIAKIPFAVPDDPVEAALGEWIESRGGNSFMEISVPDASVRLVQACGRLLRTESDRGLITILDRRLVTARYGRALLDALPPFQRRID
ncbi:ATP-dependent DNA helicase DinG [Aestuariirhabdus litorea]|uniref:ATP-dependent DNA helicase DinG n=1 Tax=Aestuariirhabdus litorea TaxID=2528527 RepID=A0A3P3VR83_9GAMM|nr:ATP-dependent DNA helicase DinG [Aestuariirhabdus litorea]RRJ84039.1 ATP-dependent DNA helicase DinG [Aestuariirhabdus litorea]RWW97260.1 ATP-dependent DNA helicase DinG [Endozoicomonadaceae bacterium GTF-13]